MKKIISSFLVLSAFTFVNAQNEINGGPVNIPAEGVIDGIYIQEHIPTKRLVPYEFVREADVMFQKRIWRYIDMREKINHPMYYPLDDFTGGGEWVKNTTRWSLWTVIRHHIMKGDLVMYDNENPNNLGSFDGDLFKYPIQMAPGKSYDTDTTFKDNVLRLIAKVTPKMENGVPAVKRDPVTGDPIIRKNPVTGIDEEVPEDPDIRWVKSEDIVEYRIKEDWFFDKERSQFDVRILGLAPVVYDADRNEKGEITTIKGKKVLFWLYFPHCRFVFVNYNVYNPKNDAQWMSFDDLFQKRQFNSTVYKQSNTFDRSIDSYKSGIDALYESQKITEEFRNFEHDLWHF
jgi:gliding motility associated protien GldN